MTTISRKSSSFHSEPYKAGTIRKQTSAYNVFGRYFGTALVHEDSQEFNDAPLAVIGMLYFNDPPTREEMIEVLKVRLLPIPRFRSVLRSDNKKFFSFPYWVEQDMDDIDFSYHVETLKQEKPFSQKDLEQYLADVATKKLDMEKPLWKCIFIKLETGQTLMLFIVYHAIADGTALVQTLTQYLVDVEENDGNEEVDPTCLDLAPVKRARPTVGWFEYIRCLVVTSFRIAFKTLLPGDSPNYLKLKDHRHPSNKSKYSFSEKISLDKVKEIKKMYPGATVNDVMLAIMTIALRKCYEEVDEPAMKQKSFRISGNFPCDMRAQGSQVMTESGFGNIVTVLDFVFPLTTPSEKLIPEIKKQIDCLKASPAPVFQLGLLDFVTKFLPPKIQRSIVLDIGGKNTAMLSNVRGPTTKRKIHGKTIDDLRFTLSVPIGLYFGCITYNNYLSATVTFDDEVPCIPSQLSKQWIPAFEELYQLSMKKEQ